MFQDAQAPSYYENRHMEEVRLSAIGIGRPYPAGKFLVIISVRGCVEQGQYCDRKSVAIEKLQRNHRKSHPQPSGL